MTIPTGTFLMGLSNAGGVGTNHDRQWCSWLSMVDVLDLWTTSVRPHSSV